MGEKILKDARCSVCRSVGSARHYDLPVFGSEGIDLCPSCRSNVCNMIHDMAMDYMRMRRDWAIAKKQKETPNG